MMYDDNKNALIFGVEYLFEILFHEVKMYVCVCIYLPLLKILKVKTLHNEKILFETKFPLKNP